MSINAGEISISVIVRTGEMQKGLNSATDAMNLFSRSASIAAGVMARDLFYAISDATREAITLGASMDTLERSFNALAGVGGQATVNIEQLDKATMGMISRVDLLTQANRALSLGVPVEELDKLFIGAIKLGKAMGLDASTSVEKLILGMGRLSYRLLDDIGIVVRAGDANKIYADQLGKTVEELTAAERATAFHQLAIEQLNEKVELLGDNIGEADKSMTQWDAALRNVTVSVGELFTPLAAIVPMIQSLGPAMSIMFIGFSNQMAQAVVASKVFKGVLFDIGELAAGTVPFLAAIGITLALLPTALKGYSRAVDDATGRTRELATASRDLAVAQKELDDATEEVAASTAWYNSLLGTITEQTGEANELDLERAKIQERVADAAEKVAKATERLEKAQDKLTNISKEYTRVQGNLVNFILSVSDSSLTYNEVLEAQQYLVEGTVPALTELTGNLASAQLQYDRATATVNKLTRAMDDNNRVLSINSIEQMKIRDAIQDREDAADIQRLGIESEIDAIEQLGRKQGFLTFAQRTQIDTLKDQVKALEDSGDATIAETIRLAELADKQRELEIQNAETSLKLEKATDRQDKHSKKVDEAQRLVDTLTGLNETLNSIYSEQSDAAEDVKERTEDLSDAEEDLRDETSALVEATDAYNTALDTLEDTHIRALDYMTSLSDKIYEQEQAWIDAKNAKEAYDMAIVTPTVPGMFEDFITGRDGVSLPGGELGDTTINNVTNNTVEGGTTGGGVTVVIENIYSDNADFIAENLKLELERKGILR